MQAGYRWDVFLSYHHGDKNRVRALAARLRAAGLRVWFDEWVIRPGDDIYAALEEGLEYARTLILCMSQAAFGSVWVNTERRTALFRDPQNTDRRFIPLVLEDCQAHIPETIRRFRSVDWRYESDAAWQELLRACQPSADAYSALSAPVFLSYVREDAAVIKQLKRDLEAYGIATWLDCMDRKLGQRWKPAIREAISQAPFFLACFSAAYHQGSDTHMTEELRLAMEHLRRRPPESPWLIPVKLNPCMLPACDIGSSQLSDLFLVELYPDWQAGVKRLEMAMRPRPLQGTQT